MKERRYSLMDQKFIQRVGHVLSYGSRQMILILGNALVALLVVRYASDAVWGQFVKIFVVVTLIANILTWGNRDYLLRGFAENPNQVDTQFGRSLKSRTVLLVIGALVLCLVLTSANRYWAIIWLIAQFTHQSLEVFIIYHRRFVVSALVEGMGLVVILVGCLVFQISASFLTQLFALSFVLRTVALILFLPPTFWSGIHIKVPNYWSFFKDAKWFFLIGLSGLLQSRIDLYIVSFFLEDVEVGRYQIMISLLILVQTISGFIMTPFSINLMRQSQEKMQVIAGKMSWLGILISSLGVCFSFYLLQVLYRFDFPAVYYLLGFLLVFPIFTYLSWIYFLYGINLEQKVMKWNFVGALTNMILTILLIPSLGIMGALLSSAFVQCGLAIVFPIIVRNLDKGSRTISR